MELFNVELEDADADSIKARYHSQDYTEAKKVKAPVIQWLPENCDLQFESVMPDATRLAGLVEKNILAEPVGSVVQMVRIGFARIDSKTQSTVIVYFSHK